MIGHKVFEILAALTRREMTRFREFAESPYHNKHKEVRALVSHLSRIYPRFHEQNCAEEVLCSQVFPGKTFDSAKLAPVFTYTRRLLEDFLAQQAYDSLDDERQLWLLGELRRRKLSELYEKQLPRAQDLVGRLPAASSHTYYQRYRLADEADRYFTQLERHRTDDSLQIKDNFLNRFYIAEKLRNACELQMRRNILKLEYSSPLLEAVLQEVSAHSDRYACEPVIMLYYRIYLMLSQDTLPPYQEAFEALLQVEAHCQPAELAELYNYFHNYCVRRINSGDEHFLEEIFRLYQHLLHKGLLYEEGYLSEWHYKNIVTTGIRLRRMEWVRAFIESEKQRLLPEVRENAYRFNLASYHHAAGQYDEVLHLLLQVEYSDIRYSLGAKALLLRTYYELKEFDALDYLVGSMRQYLLRNKLMADFHRNGYHNLFRFTRRAAQIRSNLKFTSPDKSHQELARLKQRIAGAGEIFNKSWLWEKIERLEEEITLKGAQAAKLA